jgi:hypothetical protein
MVVVNTASNGTGVAGGTTGAPAGQPARHLTGYEGGLSRVQKQVNNRGGG